MISALTDKKIMSSISMTGEITLRGDILPVGGLKEKIIGAKNAGIKKVFLPIENEKDVIEIEKEIKSNIKFIFVSNYKEVYEGLKSKKEKYKEVKK